MCNETRKLYGLPQVTYETNICEHKCNAAYDCIVYNVMCKDNE